ncbi:MAG: hypothetical protein WBF53_11975 [Litorimonas sp.]
MGNRNAVNETAAAGQAGWVIARTAAGREFTLHDAVARPKTGYRWRAEPTDHGPDRFREPIHGDGTPCYTPVEMRLAKKNQYTDKKRERRTQRPHPALRGYVFIRDPEPVLVSHFRDRGVILGLIPGVPTAANGYAPGPLLLSDRAIQTLRARYQTEYDPETGAGHTVTLDPRSLMRPGYEFAAEDYVLSDDPAWIGHKLLCVEVLDTTARVVCRLFGIDHEVEVGLGELRKAG